ncbi:MAG: CopD family protein [Nitrospinae bacterium]|nr:CopD family protein [Nitrospinota bacterium]
MRGLISVTSYWLHIGAAVIWIGGIGFILFVAIPSARQILGAEAGKLMGELSKRFTPLANYSIIFLAATGIVLTDFNKQFSGIGVSVNSWTFVLILKHILFIVMIVIHFYRGLVLTKKIGRAASSDEKAALQKLSINLVKVNFSLGMLVLLLNGYLR